MSKTRKGQNPELKMRWDGSAAWPKTDFGFTPLQYDKTAYEVLGRTNSIGLVGLNIDDGNLDKNLAPILIQRIIKEFAKYGAVAHKNHLIAIAVNPFTANILMEDLETLHFACDQFGQDAETKTLL